MPSMTRCKQQAQNVSSGKLDAVNLALLLRKYGLLHNSLTQAILQPNVTQWSWGDITLRPDLRSCIWIRGCNVVFFSYLSGAVQLAGGTWSVCNDCWPEVPLCRFHPSWARDLAHDPKQVLFHRNDFINQSSIKHSARSGTQSQYHTQGRKTMDD